MLIKINQLISSIPSYQRKIIILSLDVFLILLSYFFSLFLTSSEYLFNDLLFTLVWVIFYIFLYSVLGVYSSLTRYINSKQLYKGLAINLSLVLLLSLFNLPKYNNNFSIKFLLIFSFLVTISTILIRLFARDFILNIQKYNSSEINDYSSKLRLLIYGADTLADNVLEYCLSSDKYIVCGFIDDNIQLEGRTLLGYPIYSVSLLKNIVLKLNIETVLINPFSISRNQLSEFSNKTYGMDIPVSVLQFSGIKDSTIVPKVLNNPIPIQIEDFLGRDVVLPRNNLLNKTVEGKNIFVSGAAGSIGSQICREVIDIGIKQLIVLDVSEYNLYSLESELSKIDSIFSKEIKFITILGSACDEKLIDNIFSSYQIDVVFHAAAYKHVPLVEKNSFSGIKNNVLSTYFLALYSYKYKVKYFTIISSDKAVRPTSVMGVTKRISELIVQYLSDMNEVRNTTKFTIVRFGNVIGSSGSVIPLFKQQIAEGGPITLTDLEVTRFFMTVKEASQLVIQTSSLGESGDVFLLDMGRPIKVYDLAVKMIKLSGKTLKSFDKPDGDIEVKVTGLRPGEKLFEELLISNKSEKTSHPLIFKEKYYSNSINDKSDIIINLIEKIKSNERKDTFDLINKLVPEWKRFYRDYK